MLSRTVSMLCSVILLIASVGCMGERGVVVGFTQSTTESMSDLRSPDRPRLTRQGPLARSERERRGMPLVVAKPAAVQFPFRATLDKTTTPLLLKNIGTATLVIESLKLTGDPAFSVRAAGPKDWVMNAQSPTLELDEPLRIPPGQAWTLIVAHAPTSFDPDHAVLHVMSNDPSREQSLKVALRGFAETSCLVLSPHKLLDFEKVDVQTCRTRIVDARNCGDVPVVIEDAGLVNATSSTPFSVSWGGGSAGQAWIDQQVTAGGAQAVIVQPKEKLPIAVTYCPSKSLPFGQVDAAVVGVASSAPGPHQVALKGVPVVPACPKAAAGVAQVDAAQIGTLLQLTSHDSKASSGTISKWQWSLKAPPASVAKLMPSNNVAAPSLVVDVAGSYTFCVHVWDSGGKQSCQESCLTVHATENAAYQAGNYGAGPVW